MNCIVRSPKEARAHIQELGACLCVKLVVDSISVVSLGRLCDELGYSGSWQIGGTPAGTKGKKTNAFCTDDVAPLVAVSQQKVTPSTRHDPARENLVLGEKWRIQQTVRVFLSESLIDDGAVLTRKTPLAGKDAGEHPIACCHRCGRGNPYGEGQREPTIHAKGTSHCIHALPTRSELRIVHDDKDHR